MRHQHKYTWNMKTALICLFGAIAFIIKTSELSPFKVINLLQLFVNNPTSTLCNTLWVAAELLLMSLWSYEAPVRSLTLNRMNGTCAVTELSDYTHFLVAGSLSQLDANCNSDDQSAQQYHVSHCVILLEGHHHLKPRDSLKFLLHWYHTQNLLLCCALMSTKSYDNYLFEIFCLFAIGKNRYWNKL